MQGPPSGGYASIGCRNRVPGGFMGRVFLIVVVLGLVAAGLGFLALGAFPPEPHPVAIHKVMPNDRFVHGS